MTPPAVQRGSLRRCMTPQFTNLFSWWQWALLGLIPAAIVLLYFLKLKRTPVEVPSTYLWRKTVEDLHVNSIWQKLRRNLLLALQLLLLLLAAFALLRPEYESEQRLEPRAIFLIDVSASMSAREGQDSRLDVAKRRVAELIDEMESGHNAMLVTFADSAATEQAFTDSRAALRRALERVSPTNQSTDVAEALHVVGSIANPGRSGDDPQAGYDLPVGEPATVYLLSDGRFRDQNVPLGNLEVKYLPSGAINDGNVAITQFSTRRNDDLGGKFEAYGQLANFGPTKASVEYELVITAAGQVVARDVDRVEIEPLQRVGVAFQVPSLVEAELELRARLVDGSPFMDALAADDAAWAAINAPRRPRVLLVTPGNLPLEKALQAQVAGDLIDLVSQSPDYLTTPSYRQQAAAGAFDLILFDRCLPAEEVAADSAPTPMPEANTWFFGVTPRREEWGWRYTDARSDEPLDQPPGERQMQGAKGWPAERIIGPQVVDVERAHPMLEHAELANVLIGESWVVRPPAGGAALVEAVGFVGDKAQLRPIFSVGPREGFQDAVLGFSIMAEDDKANTDLFQRSSFPVLVLDGLKYLAGVGATEVEVSARPGQTVELRVNSNAEALTVVAPSGRSSQIVRGPQGTFEFTATTDLGMYRVLDGEQIVHRFAVNLFDPQESQIAPRRELSLMAGETVQAAEDQAIPARRELWRIFLLIALTVLIVEWYIFNRRVYL